MSLKITVPVTLRRNDEGYWLEFSSQNGNSATVSLQAVNGKLTSDILNTWADEQMQAAMLKNRRKTGLKDVVDNPVLEGDIVERFDLPGHTQVYGVVKWDQSRAAFVMEGLWPDGKTWQSQNLRAVQAAKIIGNVFEHPELLKPCLESAPPS